MNKIIIKVWQFTKTFQRFEGANLRRC